MMTPTPHRPRGHVEVPILIAYLFVLVLASETSVSMVTPLEAIRTTPQDVSTPQQATWISWGDCMPQATDLFEESFEEMPLLIRRCG